MHFDSLCPPSDLWRRIMHHGSTKQATFPGWEHIRQDKDSWGGDRVDPPCAPSSYPTGKTGVGRQRDATCDCTRCGVTRANGTLFWGGGVHVPGWGRMTRVLQGPSRSCAARGRAFRPRVTDMVQSRAPWKTHCYSIHSTRTHLIFRSRSWTEITPRSDPAPPTRSLQAPPSHTEDA